MQNITNGALNKYEAVGDALKRYMELIGDITTGVEEINVEDSLSRILYDDIVAQYCLPAINKALVDGYALNSIDIAHADAESSVALKIVGEANSEDKEELIISKNEAVKVSSGAVLPINADSVVPLEDTFTEGNKVNVFKSTVMGENIARMGEDMTKGEIFIRKRRKIRPQDIGGIIGLGYRKINVYKKPVVAIIPTGSELIPLDQAPEAGQLIASNGYVLKAAIEQLGGIGKIQSIVKDDLEQVKKAVFDALKDSDMVLVSGGSSLGSKDYTLRAIQSIENAKIVTHGIAMRPGKQTLLALIDGKPVIGLPGHPVSSFTSFLLFAKPVLVQFSGNPRSFWQERKDNIKLDAILARDVESPKGLEDYVRVRLKLLDNGKISAYPYAGKSSFLSTLVKAHGLIKLAPDCQKLYEGDRVQVLLF